MTTTNELLAGGAGPQVLVDGSLARSELVTPGMCGPNSLFVGRLGDWTWDAVSAACGINVYDARDGQGNATYLSFYYFRVRAGRDLHPLGMTFGDRLQVVSKVFGFGSESVLTVHRLRREDATAPKPILAKDFYRDDAPDTIYVDTFNRWITRSTPDSNLDLRRSSPVGLDPDRLPLLPVQHSPRPVYGSARRTGTFRPAAEGAPGGRSFSVDYPVEASRDLNAVGLLYFATYFSVIDWGLLRLYRHLGRDLQQFRERVVLDHQLCYLANAEADAVLQLEFSIRPDSEDLALEVVDTLMRERASGTLLAVSTQQLAR